ncbi:MAG TPA: hypothetical protein VME68_18165 [Acidobacteriaceae bacterium]|nr:hypothetical protein [Acidobacteriaceae bacterium]
MTFSGWQWILPASVFLPALAAAAQTATLPLATSAVPRTAMIAAQAAASVPMTPAAAAPSDPAVQALLSFQPNDIRFRVSDLMDILRDRRHEGWVLTAYPDPKTSRPLIGAGFSLDLPERPHPQLDSLNSHPFLEPSSADLWEAAGLDPQRLQRILVEFHARVDAWGVRRFRRHLGRLDPDITDADADGLLRIAIIQAVENARAYCRSFDSLNASQQMAITQLVYQMGVNLQEFDHFLALINNEPDPSLAAVSPDTAPEGTSVPAFTAAAAALAPASAVFSPAPETDADYWHAVQASLEQSQWARLYRTRAVAVIAMLDPGYAESPSTAERRIAATLHPVVRRRRRGRSVAGLRVASSSKPPRPHARTTHSAHGRRRV